MDPRNKEGGTVPLSRKDKRKQGRALAKQQNSNDIPNPSRRKWVLGSTATLIVLAAGGGVAYKVKQDADIQAKIDEYPQKEKELEPHIQRLEQGFQEFSGKSQELLNGVSEEDKKTLQKPFELFRINLTNPLRNVHAWRIRDLEEGGHVGETRVHKQNPNFFYYDFIPEDSGAVAAFVPVSRAMLISKSYDPKNILDNLIVMHELVHGLQDNFDRENLPENVYFGFLDTPLIGRARQKAVGIYEATAYIEELTMLNLFTNGEFRSDVLSTGGSINPDKYINLLHALPSQRETITFLGSMAAQFYNSRSSVQGIDVRFLDYLTRLQQNQGTDVYDRTPSGFVLIR